MEWPRAPRNSDAPGSESEPAWDNGEGSEAIAEPAAHRVRRRQQTQDSINVFCSNAVHRVNLIFMM
jgi:hypothetical protein